MTDAGIVAKTRSPAQHLRAVDRHRRAGIRAAGVGARHDDRLPARQPRQVLRVGPRVDGHRSRLGSRRHARAGPGRVLRSRRVCDGHAHEARGRRPGRGSRLHDAVRRRHHAELVGAVPQRAVHRVRHRRPAGAGVVRPRLRDPEAPGEGCLLRHPHPGDGGRVRDVADRDDQADRRLQRPEHVHDLLRPQPLRPGRSRRTCT